MPHMNQTQRDKSNSKVTQASMKCQSIMSAYTHTHTHIYNYLTAVGYIFATTSLVCTTVNV